MDYGPVDCGLTTNCSASRYYGQLTMDFRTKNYELLTTNY